MAAARDIEQRRRAAMTEQIVEIDDGSGVIRLGVNGDLAVLDVGRPVGVNWPWDEPTTGSYFLALGAAEAERRRVDAAVADAVLDIATDPASVFTGLASLWPLFDPGRYRVVLDPLGQRVDLAMSSSIGPGEDGPRTIGAAYEGGVDVVFFTQPEHRLDSTSVDAWSSRIEVGERPAGIVFSAEAPGPQNDVMTTVTPAFVLDGHHKLVAYDRLGVAPPLIRLSKLCPSMDELTLTKARFDRVIEAVEPSHRSVLEPYVPDD